MRFIFLAFFVLIASLPVQAAACDMHDAQETSHSQKGGMNHDNMDHSDDAQSMDCCDEDNDLSDQCETMSPCSASAVSLAASYSPDNSAYSMHPHQTLMNSGAPLNRSHTPPFRPPIV